MVKRGSVIFSLVLLFAFAILSIGFTSAATCTIFPGGCPVSGCYGVMKLSDLSNAHGGTLSGSPYSNILTCDFEGTRSCNGNNKIIGLSSTSNGHAEIPRNTGYNEHICYGDLSCTSTTSSSCPSNFPIEMLSLSGLSNAHLGEFDEYPHKICCQRESLGAVCGNGRVEGSERCDDRNTDSGDGCSSTCQIERNYRCIETAVGAHSCCYNNVDPVMQFRNSDGSEYTGGELSDGQTLELFIGDSFCASSNDVVNFDVVKRGWWVFSRVVGEIVGGVNPSDDSLRADWVIDSSKLESLFGDDSDSERISFTLGSDIGEADRGDVESDQITVTKPQSNCILSHARWSSSSVSEGQVVNMIAEGNSDCDGLNVVFAVEEKDVAFNDRVDISPNSAVFSNGRAILSWTTVWQNDAWPERNPPEYIFSAEPSSGFGTVSFEILDVFRSASCGNGIIDQADEECDGGDLGGADCVSEMGTGSTGTLACSGSCTYDISSCTSGQDPCGDGTCDVSGGETCSSCNADCGCPVGENCEGGQCVACIPDDSSVTCSGLSCGSVVNNCGESVSCGSCETGFICSAGSCVENADCGDGVVGGTEQCDDGNNNNNDGCSNECVLNCKVNSASWGAPSAAGGDEVSLNVQVDNCEGEVMTFKVKENDLIGDDDAATNPANVVVSGSSVVTTWVAEHPDTGGEEGDLSYYFEADIDNLGESATSDFLSVVSELEAECAGISSCADYIDEAKANADICNVGVDSAPQGTDCGETYNGNTRCMEITECSCEWNAGNGESSVEERIDCNLCGNGVIDNDEQCDDGNTVGDDGCSDVCVLENGNYPPCGEGMALCNDGTCSLSCDYTDAGYDSNPSCKEGLTYSSVDNACCKPSTVSDNVCNPYCAYADQDCGPAECGNGYREYQEECDDGNIAPGDGCSAACTLEDNILQGDGCTEGLTLCTDGTCSINCYETDDAEVACQDSQCASGLTCSLDVCCNTVSNGVCNPYCAYADPDCSSNGPSGGITIGKCTYNENSQDTCDDGWLVRDLSASWAYDATNSFSVNPEDNDYVQEGSIWRYDPIQAGSQLRKSETCKDIEDRLACPAQIQLSFFNAQNLIIAVIVIALVYVILSSRVKKKSVGKSNKKVKRKRRK